MKSNLTKMLMAGIILFTIASCSKKDDNNTTAPTAISSTQLFNYSDAWGLLAGVKTITYQTIPIIGGQQEIVIGTAVTAFSTTQGGDTYQDAGTVQCNTKPLTKQSNNSYVFQPSQSDITGIDFSSGSSWNVGGAGTIPAFTASFNSFPSSPTISSNTETVTLASGYTFSISSVSNADSILFILASGNNYVKKSVGGNATSVNFSASELSTLQASSQGLLQVTPYRYTSSTSLVPGKKVYLVNQVTVSDFAKFE